MSQITQFEFPTLEHAWSGINEFLANEQPSIERAGGGIYGTEMVLYNVVITAYKAWINPEFDFSAILGYTYKKWTKLVSNYLDLNYLDLVKSEVLEREKKRSANYTHSMHFTNTHASGKDCLISLTFCKQINNPNPVVIYHTRATECTKRMIFDFLLIQKICEYVYGKERTVEVKMFIPFMFIAVEGFLLYTNYNPIEKSVRFHNKPEKQNPFQKRISQCYTKFMGLDVNTIKYKVHKRSALGIQRGKDGKPLHGRIPYKVKDIDLIPKKKLREKDIEKLNANLAI